MKKKIFKSLAVVACALLLVVGSVVGTFAYLTSTTEEVKNTFTVGDISITLNESKLNADGKTVDTNQKVTEQTYHLVPGATYAKDPTVHLGAKSDSAWMFVKVVNSLSAIETTDATKTIDAQIKANGWSTVISDTNSLENGVNTVTTVYAYKATVSNATDAAVDYNVFKNVVIHTDIDNATMKAHADKTISVIAYAVQADGFTTAQAAWDATFGKPNTP